MNVQGSSGSTPLQNSQEMMAVISRALQLQQENAEKMIKLAIEAKTANGKNDLLGKVVDLIY